MTKTIVFFADGKKIGCRWNGYQLADKTWKRRARTRHVVEDVRRFCLLNGDDYRVVLSKKGEKTRVPVTPIFQNGGFYPELRHVGEIGEFAPLPNRTFLRITKALTLDSLPTEVTATPNQAVPTVSATPLETFSDKGMESPWGIFFDPLFWVRRTVEVLVGAK